MSEIKWGYFKQSLTVKMEANLLEKPNAPLNLSMYLLLKCNLPFTFLQRLSRLHVFCCSHILNSGLSPHRKVTVEFYSVSNSN